MTVIVVCKLYCLLIIAVCRLPLSHDFFKF